MPKKGGSGEREMDYTFDNPVSVAGDSKPKKDDDGKGGGGPPVLVIGIVAGVCCLIILIVVLVVALGGDDEAATAAPAATVTAPAPAPPAPEPPPPPPDVDCVMTYTPCTVLCEDATTRTATVVTPQSGNGAQCTFIGMSCQRGEGACPPAIPVAPPPPPGQPLVPDRG